MPTPVPYSPVPDVAPQLDPTSSVHIDTPTAAFGGAVGAAIGQLGQATEGAGKELFDRAYAMQELNENMKADAAAADAIGKQTDAYLNYSKLRGQALLDGNDAYKANLAQIRTDGAEGLSPYARNLYLQQTRRNEAAMVWHGGVLAKEGQTAAITETARLQRDTLGNEAANVASMEPGSPQWNSMVQTMHDSAVHEAQISPAGLQPGTPESEQFAADAVSKQLAGIVRKVAQTNPQRAKSIYDAVQGQIRPADGYGIPDLIDHGMNTKVAPTIGKGAADGSLTGSWAKTVVDDKAAVQGLKAASPTHGAYNAKGPVMADGSYQVGAYGVNSNLLPQLLKDSDITDEDGKPVKTEEQFLASNKAQDQTATLFNQMQKEQKAYGPALAKWTGRANAIVDAAPTAAKHSDANTIQSVAEDTARAAGLSPEGVQTAGQHGVIAANAATRDQTIADRADMTVAMTLVNGQMSGSGKVPTTFDSAMEDPTFRRVWTNLDARGDTASQQALLKQIQKNNEHGGQLPTAQNEAITARYMRIAADRNAGATTADLTDLANAKLETMNLTPEQFAKVSKAQAEVLSNAQQDPKIDAAMKLPAVEKIMSDWGITKGTPEYDQFRSSYFDAVKSYDLGKMTPAKTSDELEAIAMKLVNRTPGKLWGYNYPSNQPYKGLTEAYPNLRNGARDIFRKAQGRDPETDEDWAAADRMILRAKFGAVGAGKTQRVDQ